MSDDGHMDFNSTDIPEIQFDPEIAPHLRKFNGVEIKEIVNASRPKSQLFADADALAAENKKKPNGEITCEVIADPVSIEKKSLNLPPNIDGVFWDAHEKIQKIYLYALTGEVSPDSVYHAICSRLSGSMPKGTWIGGPSDTFRKEAPLNHFSVHVGISSLGKGSADYLARLAVEGNLHIREGSVGSGEALEQMFMGRTSDKEPEQICWNAIVGYDEALKLQNINKRENSSTVISTLTTAWRGTPMITYLADTKRSRNVKDYNLGLTIQGQPELLSWLSGEDVKTIGLCARLLWASLWHPDDRPSIPLQKLFIPVPSQPVEFILDKKIHEFIMDQKSALRKGIISTNNHPHWSHARMAAITHWIMNPGEHRRICVPYSAWELTELPMKSSAGVCQWVSDQAKAKRSADNQQRGTDQAEAQAGREAARDAMLNEMAVKIRKDKKNKLTHSEIRDLFTKCERARTDEAIEFCINMGWLTEMVGIRRGRAYEQMR